MLDSKRLTPILPPVLVGIVLLFIPLLGDFHFESALLVSLAGCFWAGIRACHSSSEQNDFWDALQVAGSLFLVGFPLLLNALFTGCFSIDGLGFWLLFPLPSVFFGFALGRLFQAWKLSHRRYLVVAVLLVISIGFFLYELLTYPQVYFFNHVWGGWPGPIYDETVRIQASTVFFRGLTTLWAILLWNIPTINTDQFSKWVVGLAAIAIAISYTQLAEIGIISPRSHLQQMLAGHQSTEHFEIYYDHRLYSDNEIARLAQEHEFYYDQITQQLDLTEHDTTNKIESYLYGHPWQKKRLVGAKFTSYVPIWLDQDQLHIARQQIESSLKHELVHVLAKQFGNSLFNGSWSIGLIEGIAVAIDGGSSNTSTIDQIVVSEKPYPKAAELQRAFSISGFYGGRSGVNYTTSGSFVRFLMQNYPVASLKEAYRSGDLAQSYSADWQTLTSQWHQHLDSVQVDSVDQQTASRIFGIRSLFEKECPHAVSDFAAAWDEYRFHMANRDTVRALRQLDRAVAAADSLPRVKAEWSYQHLVNRATKKVEQAASLQDTTVDLQLLYADSFAMTGNRRQMQKYLTKVQQLFAQKPDSLLEPALATRMNPRQWSLYRAMMYQQQLPDSSTFKVMYYRTKIRSLQKAIEQERWDLTGQYASQLKTMPLQLRNFDDYQQLIHLLGFYGDAKLARGLLEKVSTMDLRDRYQERLQQERAWLEFLESEKSTER